MRPLLALALIVACAAPAAALEIKVNGTTVVSGGNIVCRAYCPRGVHAKTLISGGCIRDADQSTLPAALMSNGPVYPSTGRPYWLCEWKALELPGTLQASCTAVCTQ